MTTDALYGRVRRLESILTACAASAEKSNSADEPATVAALKHFSAVLRVVQQLTGEVRSRVGVGEWDATDALEARMLLDAMTSALRDCRVVTQHATARLRDVHLTVTTGLEALRRNAIDTRKA